MWKWMLLPTEPMLWKHMPDVLLKGKKKPWHLNEQNCYFGALRAFWFWPFWRSHYGPSEIKAGLKLPWLENSGWFKRWLVIACVCVKAFTRFVQNLIIFNKLRCLALGARCTAFIALPERVAVNLTDQFVPMASGAVHLHLFALFLLTEVNHWSNKLPLCGVALGYTSGNLTADGLNVQPLFDVLIHSKAS